MKPTFSKKISAGFIVSALAFIVGLVSIIIYGVNVARGGYFNGGSVPEVVRFGIFALVFLAISIALYFVRFTGKIGKIVDMVGLALRVLASLFFAFALIYLIQARAEGLSYIFFSNDDVKLALQQNPDNMISANLAITSIVMYGISVAVGCVSSFFGYKAIEEPLTSAK